MTNYSRHNYEIDYYRIPGSSNGRVDRFAPTIQSLRAAQDIVRRYENGRRTAAKTGRQSRVTFTAHNPALRAGVDDNVIAFRSPVWARPSSRLIYSRHPSPPSTRSPGARARRASIQAEAQRVSRDFRASTASPVRSATSDTFDAASNEMLDRIMVMAIQGLAVVLGLSGLLALLAMI